MALVKVIEVIASSQTSFDEAIRNAVTEVTQTVKNVDSVYVKDFKVHVQGNEIKSFGAVCKVSFRIDENERQKNNA